MDPAVIGLGIAVAVQLAGIVWGAAVLRSTVASLQNTVQDLTESVDKLQCAVNKLDKRVSILEDRQTRGAA